MNQELELLERVDLYLEGKLPLKDAEDFELRMKTDQQLSDLVFRQKISNDLIVAERLHALKTRMDLDFNAGLVKGSKGGGKWWIVGISISAIISMSLLYLSTNQKSETRIFPNLKKEEVDLKAPLTDASESKEFNRKENKNSKASIDEDSDLKELDMENPVKSEAVEELHEPLSQNKLSPEEKDVSPSIVTPPKENISDVHNLPFSEENVKEGKVKINETHKDLQIKKGSEYSFRPEYGEVAQLPVESGKDAEIKIFSRSGNLVYSEKLIGVENYTWDGRSIQGGISPAGLYIYMLEYTNGEKESGQIVIY